MEMQGNIAALLSHQLEQLFKLESSLRAEKGEVDLLSHEVRDLEMKWNRKSIKTPAHQLEVEVDKLETDITNLRGECDIMSERVTDLTGGKVPLGETSVNFTDFLHKPAGDNTDGPPVAEPMETETPAPSDLVAGEGGKWNCSQCTFANHPQLDTCEICNMPKIKTGYESRSAQSPH